MDVFVLKGSVTGSMTDEEFFRFCSENPDLRIERNNKLEILIMSPVTSLSSYYSGAAFAQLFNWSIKDKSGLAFDSSAGFTLPDRSVLSPDASWVSLQKWNDLTEEEKNRFAPVCPEFVIEVKSKTDYLPDLKKKMLSWLQNGCALAWLIDPDAECVYIFKPGQPESIVEGFNQTLTADSPVKGFELDLSVLKAQK